MELTAILLARTLAFFDTADVIPRKGLFPPELVKGLVQLCNFQKFPKAFEEWGSADGAIFEVGKLGETTIRRLIIYNACVQVETFDSTAESRRLIDVILGWARENFDISYQGESSVRNWAYISDVSFRSDVPLLLTGPIERLSRRITEEMSKILEAETVYQPAGFNIGHDPLLRRYGRAPFSIQRRAEALYTDNKYFSEAPLPTDVHLELLEQYERDVAQMLNVR